MTLLFSACVRVLKPCSLDLWFRECNSLMVVSSYLSWVVIRCAWAITITQKPCLVRVKVLKPSSYNVWFSECNTSMVVCSYLASHTLRFSHYHHAERLVAWWVGGSHKFMQMAWDTVWKIPRNFLNIFIKMFCWLPFWRLRNFSATLSF